MRIISPTGARQVTTMKRANTNDTSNNTNKLNINLNTDSNAEMIVTEREYAEDALYVAWSEDRQTGAPQPLHAWIDRYPEHRHSLIDWATEMPVVEYGLEYAVPDAVGEAQTLAIGKSVLSEMRTRYFAVQTSAAPINTVPINDLVQTAKARGLTAKALAAKLGVGLSLMAKLNQRLLKVGTLPQTLIDRLAAELNTGVAEVRDYLARPATLAAAAQYKSDGVPQVAEAEEFAEALRACSDMTVEQKQFWLDLS